MPLEKIITSVIDNLSSGSATPIELLHTERVHGGDINHCFCLQTNAGNFFLKVNTSRYDDMLEKEARGLVELATARHQLVIPKVLHWGKLDSHQFLVMDWLDIATNDQVSTESLGTGIAALHHNTNQCFGFSENNYIGSLPQQNKLCFLWEEFYTDSRIMPLLKRAFDNQLCSYDDVLTAESLCKQLSNIFPEEPPSLLHGDLWSGNYSFTKEGTPAIFDPAVYYGHREMDIAMTLLFGGFPSSFYSAYEYYFPLQSGWQQRVGICQLYPLLVHLLLFGKGYYDRVKTVLGKYN